ncbi:MAG: ABC transporter permease [Planctomycetes bacterium]|nr:ABC transporter permease [Planctomycetota bacterium]
MWAGIARRCLVSIPVCLAASLLVFFLLEAAPGEPVQYLSDPEASAEAAREQAGVFGYFDPMPVRLWRWIENTITFDFGRSILDGRPVRDKVFEALPHTLLLSGVSLILGFALGIAIALISAWRPRGALDLFISASGVAIASVPVFWMGTWAVAWFAAEWKWFPTGGDVAIDAMVEPGWHAADRIYHLILPAGILILVTSVQVARFTRAALLATLREEFIQSARARGASRARVLLGHALPASLHSTVALFGLSIPWLIGGSAVVEYIFNYPGTGRLFIEAMKRRDYPVVCAAVIMLSFMAVLGNALADALAIRFDPRAEDRPNV